MRYAAISDIHGNMEAFDAVLSDIDCSGIDEIICLGDNIGYGAEPEAVLSLLQERRIVSISGNHEMAACHPEQLNDFNPTARISLEITRGMLSGQAWSWIRQMPVFLSTPMYRFVHGFPPDSYSIYLFMVSGPDLYHAFSATREKICFLGHTHDLEMVEFNGLRTKRLPLGRGTVSLDKDKRYLINVGSVGQPRDGNHDAKYAVWDDETLILDIRFVPYDIEAAAEKIIRAGLPKRHALRLFPP